MQAVGIRRGLTIDPAGEEEAPAARVGRLVRESPVVIFARRGCYMAHVMKSLLAAVGAHATVIELDAGAPAEEELAAAADAGGHGAVPALFVGGAPVGGLEGLMNLHLSGRLVPRLREVGALCA
ncbi:Monothiol glutaredoxin-S2 [Dichanthelium oligosanthes]|uniref:Monothiol glutaredoxin-S2 n=1 Tax=Dichanthelium oligosanthes TaxID=888268 RepID=A0A1E5WH58_9POAL|nr:Monothiol glutaredoxin-S2 [Dichanthelium oligosanthes]